MKAEDPNIVTISKRGDIWKLGNHRLMCGDATVTADVEKLMDDHLAQMVWTDPPWCVNYGGTDHPSWKRRSITNDNMSAEEFDKFLRTAFANMNTVSVAGAMTYLVMGSSMWGTLMPALAENGYHWSSTIIWVKDSFVLSRKDYHTQYEPIWYGWKSGSPRLHPLTDRKQSDVWIVPRPKKSEEHPTMKPIDLVARAIGNSSDPGDIVLDLFGGSGSTMLACEQLGRVCFTMEIEPKYCDVIVARWEKATGKTAELLTTTSDFPTATVSESDNYYFQMDVEPVAQTLKEDVDE